MAIDKHRAVVQPDGCQEKRCHPSARGAPVALLEFLTDANDNAFEMLVEGIGVHDGSWRCGIHVTSGLLGEEE